MIKAKAYAKLNLNLHVLPDQEYKQKTGYYPIRFINCNLELHDELYFEEQKRTIDFTCDDKELSNGDNFVYKTAFFLKSLINEKERGIRILLKKHIPVKAGLGGGSSDAATTLYYLSRLWNIKLNQNQIHFLLEKIGTDTFYSYKEGVCEVGGYGTENTCIFKVNKNCFFHKRKCLSVNNTDKTCKLSQIPRIWMILVNPEKQKQSTAWMYHNLNLSKIGKNLAMYDALKQAIHKKNKGKIVKSVFNDFEQLVKEGDEETLEIEKRLYNMGADKVFIAGSGPTIVGLYLSKKKSLEASQYLKIKYKQTIWTHTR
ncbi:hypothetical protein A2334_00400 [Candidatus Roizmanbacteria bacterium RIFOXYB2_FULL_38_10]|uniref:4-diphosphocytidyl-2-C-methyl-D-erythritol kinase n=1 Tax=Candidatus Roizmanbacteria bacterium RIFOXYD1_FULL_38_12 TaxID=1802093 RepID=A0A1F7L2B2_9BACT|nr:MAG: hypothetical protein A3K47_05945 [Candidatus Roizmanbacteria bacterium RIFOXYA2_FULL_38_14]OGK64282.1 MAG: hypothetical protein A3K27_05945 [Candidatus Roizmanbacteria bacterium RIFOXYA1_FULL_37_12]OGK66128.1 MAG: hypothetical protein A3K38_05945 [Candidatus Roizmanbacteria bacterium RIFOXYB1_FULL_40_23]OGK67693.1 MAG: hypothetical protein A2334_00400 [Candidatus Roizmanbacteria bacterium RIFOXYB2_FULL_38_10]OGK70533.1 MAG: hypothetical protein A3K21_05950 [Candidatus Roizmanbacteria ba